MNVVYNAHDVATNVLTFEATTNSIIAIIIPSSGFVFVACRFMDQQKTTSTFTSMDQENSWYIYFYFFFACMF